MHWSILTTTLLAAGAAALDLRARGNLAPVLPDFKTPKFQTISPEDAMSSLKAKAQASPTAVKPVAGMPFTVDPSGVIQDVEATGTPLKDGKLGLNIPNPVKAPSKEKRQSSSCTNPEVHVEWNNLSSSEQQAFAEAIACLFSKPARSGLAGTQTRWDDLAAIHQGLNTQIHMVGQFVPWHRYFLWIFEQELRNTCGYTGSMAWWDETKNAGDFTNAPIFGSSYFGSAPDGNAVCITNGQFSNLECHIGPGSSDTDHCLSRGVNEQTTSSITSSYVSTCQSYTDYNDMQNCIDYGPHALGHDGIGGVMGDVQSSPQDPIFFVHHAFVDHIWRLWQVADPTDRTYQVGGYIEQGCSSASSSCQPLTLQYELTSYNFYPSVTVDQVMDTEGGFLCYHYDY